MKLLASAPAAFCGFVIDQPITQGRADTYRATALSAKNSTRTARLAVPPKRSADRLTRTARSASSELSLPSAFLLSRTALPT